MICIFSPVSTIKGTPQTEETILLTPTICIPMNYQEFQSKYPLLVIKNGQAAYEMSTFNYDYQHNYNYSDSITEPSIELETSLFKDYFKSVHPAYPLLFKQCIMNIHSKDRNLLSKPLRYAIMMSASTCKLSDSFYQLARKELYLTSPKFSLPMLPVRLDTVQSLLLMYKYNNKASYYLQLAHTLLNQLPSHVLFQHQQQSEMILRARWILFTSIALSNLYDSTLYDLYIQIDLPADLPQPLDEELQEQDGPALINRFSQIVNLSVLYSHTVQSMITGSVSHIICIDQFKTTRQHWHDSLNPVTQNALISQQDRIDILILYNAVIYDTLYLLLLSRNYHHHYHDAIETSYRLQVMVQKWIKHSGFSSAIQSKRMAIFALLLCLQIHILSNTFDCVENIRLIINSIQSPIDSRLDQQLNELLGQLTLDRITTPSSPYEQQPQPQQLDYFSLRPRQQTLMPSTNCSSPSTPLCLNSPLVQDKEWVGLIMPQEHTLLQEQLQQLQIEESDQ